jgi:hypothetical protein
VDRDEPRAVDEGFVIVEPDEVKTRLSSLCCFSVLEFMPESVPSRSVFQVGMQ